MPIYVGNNKISKVFFGTEEINLGYFANALVYSANTETLLGNVTVYATGDYAYNYFSNAKAYLLRQNGKYYLKVTGKWYSKGENVSGNVTQFSTNINVGAQKRQINFTCQCYLNTTSDTGNVYATYGGYVKTDGTLYLPLGHENVYRTFNQYDYAQVLIELDPA